MSQSVVFERDSAKRIANAARQAEASQNFSRQVDPPARQQIVDFDFVLTLTPAYLTPRRNPFNLSMEMVPLLWYGARIVPQSRDEPIEQIGAFAIHKLTSQAPSFKGRPGSSALSNAVLVGNILGKRMIAGDVVLGKNYGLPRPGMYGEKLQDFTNGGTLNASIEDIASMPVYLGVTESSALFSGFFRFISGIDVGVNADGLVNRISPVIGNAYFVDGSWVSSAPSPPIPPSFYTPIFTGGTASIFS